MIEIKRIKKSFGGKPVLKGISLDIPEKKATVLIGRSGCGKTVLLRILIGLLRPDEGQVLVDGEDMAGLSRKALFRARRKFGMLFQSAALFDSMTVGENISLALREHTDLSKTEIAEKVREKLDLVGLEGVEDRMPSELSGGMKKRVGLARALIMDPRYVLYDEPTTGLDPETADAINELIGGTGRRLGITSVVVTHDLVSARRIGDRFAMISEGHIVFDGTPEGFQACQKPAVRRFINGSGLDLEERI
ncbi:ABC transporter ATP-binding protein [bacterium]|nr:ABC transporter ATP-binding protein [bacterium]